MNRGRLARNRRPAAAFTLLELLVATSVAAIVLLVINATFFTALRLHNTTHDRIDEDLALQRTVAIVRRDLAGIMLPGGTLSGQLITGVGGTTELDVEGGERISPDIYTSSGRVDGWSSFADVQMISYFLTADPNGGSAKNLVRVVTRNLLPVEDATSTQETLLSGVTSAEVLFYDGTDWTDTWDSTATSTLPSAIKFSVALAPREANPTVVNQAPVDLIVPVLVSTRTSAQQAAAAAAADSGT
jgi:prepilin-type N-terminal cleavage/methylation domain-containing protein